MIKAMYENGFTGAIVVCDICEKRIEDAGGGAAVYPSVYTEEEILEVLHVHRGSCRKMAEKKLGGKNNTVSDELIDHMLNACASVGLSVEELERKRNANRESGVSRL